MNISSLDKLLEDELKDLYSAENQLIKALPKMIKKASNQALKEAIQSHLEETKGQVDRLNKIAELLDIRLSGKKCKAMEGLLEEGKEILEAEGEEPLLDAALIGAAQRVEHYEMAGYGTARAFAQHLGLEEVAQLLSETLEEESAADEKLTALSVDEILPSATMEDDEDEDEEEGDEEEIESDEEEVTAEEEEEAPQASSRRRRS